MPGREVSPRIVQTLDELRRYKYCGHSALMGKWKRGWQNTDYVLSYFGKSKEPGRNMKSFIKEGLGQGRRGELIAKMGDQ